MVPFKMEIPHYEECQKMDKVELKEKDWNQINLFDGYKKKKGEEKKEEKINIEKVQPGKILSFGYNLCCNAIDDNQKQSLCEVCSSCDPLT